jgi:tripartite-type tricarboxylate transporter receptor subunit TctC
MLTRSAVAMLMLVLMPSTAVNADAVADFYRGRTVNLVVGYGPGGGYDLCARLVARHIGRYIPGNPTVVVQNMPGAGSLRAANFLYAVAPNDGATIGAFARDMPLPAVLGNMSGVRFDPRKFAWLGSSSSFANDAHILMVRADAPAKSTEEARRPGGPPLVLGSTAEGTSGNDVPTLLRDTLGFNIRLVAGYPDNGAIFLAVDRGEVNGRTVDLTTMKSLRPDWLKPDGAMRGIVHTDGARARDRRDIASVDRAGGAALCNGSAPCCAARRSGGTRGGAASSLSGRASRCTIPRRRGAAQNRGGRGRGGRRSAGH